MICPACSSKQKKQYDEKHHYTYQCLKCHCVYSESIYLGETYEIVSPFMDSSDPKMEKSIPFDFNYLGSKGIGRRHGWFNPETKRVTQVG